MDRNIKFDDSIAINEFSKFQEHIGIQELGQIFTVPITLDLLNRCNVPPKEQLMYSHAMCFFGVANLYNIYGFVKKIRSPKLRL